MSELVLVQIISAPIACKESVKDTWREIAEWFGGQLHQRFCESMDVQYFFLCDPECPPMPPGAQLPLVLVNGDVLASGGKISVPVIRCKIEDILKKEIA